MKTVVLAFGIVKEIINGDSKEMNLQDEMSVKDLKTKLETDYPELKELQSFMIAVNNEYAEDDLILQPEDEIAVIPPVSGG